MAEEGEMEGVTVEVVVEGLTVEGGEVDLPVEGVGVGLPVGGVVEDFPVEVEDVVEDLKPEAEILRKERTGGVPAVASKTSPTG